MKVYLAAAMHRRMEIQKIVPRITALGITITSHWLGETAEQTAIWNQKTHTDAERREHFVFMAAQDASDVRRSDVVVRFSDDLSTDTVPAKWCTASRMEECGMAHAWGKQIVIVGGHQSLFDNFAGRVHVADVDALIAFLKTAKHVEDVCSPGVCA